MKVPFQTGLLLAIILSLGSITFGASALKKAKVSIEKNKAPSDLTKDEAHKLVSSKLLKQNPKDNLLINDELTKEYDFGWLFYLGTKEYLETKNPNHQVPGVGPVLVDKSSRRIEFLPARPSHITQKSIEDFQLRWRLKNKKPSK